MCRQRCAEAKTKHGNKTRAIRAAYRDGMRKLDELKVQARKMGIIIGNKTPGRKPNGNER